MTWIMMAMRKQQLKKEISDIQLEKVKISNTIQDLAKFTSNIADGIITFAEGGSCPSDFFGTQLDFMAGSAQAAYQSATVKTNAYLSQLAQTNGMTGNQYGYAMTNNMYGTYGTPDAATIFNDIYKEELKKYSEQISSDMHQYEEELNQENERLAVQEQAKNAELQAYEQSISQNIQSDAIKFA